jgi:hypothetical protein
MKRSDLPYPVVILFKIQAAAEYILSYSPIRTRKVGLSIQCRDKGDGEVVDVHAMRTYEEKEV